jgi:transcription initiation factor TFIIIB Brf1 subunit/transcription initiation factor TFIIB
MEFLFKNISITFNIKMSSGKVDIFTQIQNGLPSETGLVVNKRRLNPFESDTNEVEFEKKTHNKALQRHAIKCNDCNIEMHKSPEQMAYICPGCSRLEEIVGTAADVYHEAENGTAIVNNYNTSDNSSAPVKIAGPGNYVFQKKLVGATSNYKKTQKKNTIDQMIGIIYQYQGNRPPHNVVLDAADLYYEVQQHCIKRGDVRMGAMAACLYRLCDHHGITRKPKEIADIFHIEQSELSNGEKILDELDAKGLLKKIKTKTIKDSNNTDQNDAQMIAFLNRYFECLNIPTSYKEFATRLIRFTKKYRIAVSSIMSSKCAGVIYILSTRVKELNIKRETIEKECNISKSTFGRFAKEVMIILASTDPKIFKVKSRLSNIFKKHSISKIPDPLLKTRVR